MTQHTTDIMSGELVIHTGTKIPAQNNLDSWYSPRTTCRSHSMLPASGFSLFHEIKNSLLV